MGQMRSIKKQLVPKRQTLILVSFVDKKFTDGALWCVYTLTM
jgi:hypothetical protein